MEYSGGRMKNINIAYIGGGSCGWAWKLMADLALEEKMSGCIKLYDLDFNAASNNEMIGNSMHDRNETKGKWKYKAVNKIEEALTGADFVIISIMTGSFKEMESDVHAPEKYGIYQAVGDTVGPGGLLRAMRTIPVYIDFAEKIRKYCPDAWVINYTNPMTVCTRILYEVFPGIKAFGCCHEVFSTQVLMSDILTQMKGIENIIRHDIKTNVKGINHFTWIDKASYKGIDIIPLYKEFAEKYYVEGYFDSRQKSRNDEDVHYFGCWNRVKFDLFKRFNMIAAAGDRHLAEFTPQWYLKDPDCAEKWKFTLTPVSFRIGKQKRRIDFSREVISGKKEFEIKKSSEEGVDQLKALCGLEDFVTNVNLPNYGQLEGFPEGVVVETNALFTKNRVQPVIAGKFPDPVKNLIMRHVLNQETIVKAGINRDRNLAFNAFINDPLVNIPADDALKLFNEMEDNTKKYLTGWNK